MKKLIFSIFILFTFILLFYIYNTDMFIDEQKINENTNLDDEPLEIVVEEFPSFTDSNILHMEKYTKDEVIKRFGEPSKKLVLCIVRKFLFIQIHSLFIFKLGL